MTRFETQGKMFCGHLARVTGRPPCHPRPELANFGEMGWPILDPFIKHRANQSVLSNIRVEMSQQSGDSLPATNPIKEAGAVLFHIVERKYSQGVAR